MDRVGRYPISITAFIVRNLMSHIFLAAFSIGVYWECQRSCCTASMSASPKSVPIKSFVYILCILDLVQTIGSTYSSYYALVSGWGGPSVLI
ncbi:hypothetical protein IW262DRAFT_6433 [Armillaria fumosa]|nr:hypothetical protein IW262DRAFT_6433 [Armillaria fumosa]